MRMFLIKNHSVKTYVWTLHCIISNESFLTTSYEVHEHNTRRRVTWYHHDVNLTFFSHRPFGHAVLATSCKADGLPQLGMCFNHMHSVGKGIFHLTINSGIEWAITPIHTRHFITRPVKCRPGTWLRAVSLNLHHFTAPTHSILPIP
jgi:hypothetical protein